MSLELNDLYKEIVGFYRGWHHLETSGKYRDGHKVIDQDYSPLCESARYSTRREALAVLDDIRLRAGDAGADQAVLDNLRASETYLRATLGERLSIRDYVRQQYLYDPAPVSERTLDAVAGEVRELCQAFGLTYRRESREEYLRQFRVETGEEVAELVQPSKAFWLERLFRHIDPPDDLDVEVTTVDLDEPWSFFITHTGGRTVFRINVHPRHTFTRGQCLYIASHEIAGHAVQHPLWAQAIERDGLPSALQIHATHHPIAALAEGLAQALPYFLVPVAKMDPVMLLAKRLRELRDMTIANAQLMIEGGAPVTAAWDYCASRLFFVDPFEIERDLADRMLKPAERAYQHCYSPSFLAYLAFADRLAEDEISSFLRAQYHKLPSPRNFWRQSRRMSSG